MRALLDGDLYAFRSAASAENEDLGIAIARLEEMIDNTVRETGAQEFSIFLSGENNFRYRIYPEYKANRPAERPIHLADVKKYLVDKYQAIVADGCEADDLLGIEQCANDGTIICSLDKDLRMVPGNHYSFEIRGTSSLGKQWTRPAELTFVNNEEALRHFYMQLLIGDPADNVKGAMGIGKVKAERLLADCQSEKDMLEVVKDQFATEEELIMTARVLWIWRKHNDDILERWQSIDPTIGKGERPFSTEMDAGHNPDSVPEPN